MFSCAAAFYKAADLENVSGILWAALSIATYCLTWFLFGWSFPGNLLGQGALLIGIALARATRHFRKPP